MAFTDVIYFIILEIATMYWSCNILFFSLGLILHFVPKNGLWSHELNGYIIIWMILNCDTNLS